VGESHLDRALRRADRVREALVDMLPVRTVDLGRTWVQASGEAERLVREHAALVRLAFEQSKRRARRDGKAKGK
jgi:hypothetical protein